MQEEIEHKTVNFAISTVKLSARTLLKGAQFFLRQYDKSASQGKQSMKRLIRQNRGVTNLEIEKTGIKDFDRCAKRYHIDYRSFCPCGNLVGECLPQTLLMRLTPLEKFPQILFGLFQKQFRYTPRFSPISERTPRTERRSTTYETI